MRRIAAALSLGLLLSGCYRIRYVTKLLPEPRPTERLWHHTFVYGLIEASPPIEVARICPDGFALVENQETLANFIPSGALDLAAASALYATTRVPLVIDLWTPLTVEVTCSSGPANP